MVPWPGFKSGGIVAIGDIKWILVLVAQCLSSWLNYWGSGFISPSTYYHCNYASFLLSYWYVIVTLFMAQIHHAPCIRSPYVFLKMLCHCKVWHKKNVSIPWSWWYNMQWAFFHFTMPLISAVPSLFLCI